MFFYLKSHEDNMEYIKCIGDGYSIGKEETDGDYVIKLDSAATSCPWLELLQKKEQWYATLIFNFESKSEK